MSSLLLPNVQRIVETRSSGLSEIKFPWPLAGITKLVGDVELGRLKARVEPQHVMRVCDLGNHHSRGTSGWCSYPQHGYFEGTIRPNLALYTQTGPSGQGCRLVRDWHPVSIAPFNRDLQLGVIEQGEVHSLAFPCRRTEHGWMDTATRKRIFIDFTHWREWAKCTSS
jgi:hypothetical protein